MKQTKRMSFFRLMGMLALLTALATGWAFAEGLEKDVVVLFTSDVHCGVEQGFGYAGLKAIKTQMEREGNHVLLVDNGDSIQGEPVGLLTQGEAIIELMNRMGYDVAIPGNHEFEYGLECFLSLTEKANYPYVSCNFNREGKLVFPAYVMKEFDGVKLAFVGVTTPKTLLSSTPRFFQDDDGNFIYGFMQENDGADLYAGVQRAVDDARAEGADYVFLMGHLGLEAEAEPYTYADVLSHTTGIDAMLDGHSHDLEKVVMKDRDGKRIIRQACGTKLKGVGWMRISAADGSVDTGVYTWNNPVPAPKLLGIENDMTQAVDDTLNGLDEWLSTKVGVSAVDLLVEDASAVGDDGKPVRVMKLAETNMGDLLTDAFRAFTGADVAIMSGGSARKTLPAGDITIRNLVSVFPFGNHVTLLEITGQQLLDALEWGSRYVPLPSGAFPHVSGMSFEVHTDIKSGCQADDHDRFVRVEGKYRVKNVMVGGEPLDLQRTYKIAGQDFMLLSQGNGYTMFKGGKVLIQPAELDYMAVASYIQNDLKGVIGEEYAAPYGQGRVVAVEEMKAAA